MKYYLYTFSDNWADEMDVQGFAIMTEKQKDISLSAIRRYYKNGGEISFGTNESNDYDSLEDVLACVEFKEISKSEYESVLNVFEGSTMGELGPLKILEEDEDEEYEEDEEDDDDEDMYEAEYDGQAKRICEFIKDEFGILETSSSYFLWKPTPKSEITISILDYDSAEEVSDYEQIEVSLKYNGKEMGFEFFEVNVIYHDFEIMSKQIKQFIEKAKSY